MSEVTRILSEIESGNPTAAEQLLPLIYDELRQLAAAHLAKEQAGQTLQPTALVHEAYLRLVGPGRQAESDSGGGNRACETGSAEVAGTYNSRGHFFGAAAVAIRRILIDNARRKGSQKRGGGAVRLSLDEIQPTLPEPREDLLALDEALDRLGGVHPQAAELVQLLYFAGLTLPEAAKALGVSPRTSGRLWSYARAWLRRELDV
jgi:RNA polymerase sigma factor (sigma-70 family)